MKSWINMYAVCEPVFFPREIVYDNKEGKCFHTTHVDGYGMRTFNKLSREMSETVQSLIGKKNKELRLLIVAKIQRHVF